MKMHHECLPEVDPLQVQKLIREGKAKVRANRPIYRSSYRIFFLQLRYLSPDFWLSQVVALILMMVSVTYLPKSLNMDVQLIALMAPISSMFAIPELFKDLTFHMTEMERSCPFSGAKMMTLRLLAVGGMNMATLLLLSTICSLSLQANFLYVVLNALLPVSVLHALSLFLLRWTKRAGRSAAVAVTFFSVVMVAYFGVWSELLIRWSARARLLILILFIWLIGREMRRYKEALERKEDIA